MSMQRYRRFLFALTCLSFILVAEAQQAPVLDLSAGMYRIEAEVMNTQRGRMRGLMQRESMPPQHGMLFVFDADAQHCMWMKNTLLPLSVAFLDRNGRVINIEEMQPESEDNHCAAKPARFALEMNAGWFRKRGIGPGAIIGGIDRAPPAR
jgi:uncharacterized protein